MRPAIPRRVRHLVRYLACMGLYGRRGHLLPWLQRPGYPAAGPRGQAGLPSVMSSGGVRV